MRVHPSIVVAGLAASQYGVVARRQLVARGLSEAGIGRQVGVRRLHQVHAGVYCVIPPHLLSLNGRHLAAVMACGAGAVLSHRDAATLWGVRHAGSGDVDVTIPRGGSRNRSGITVHTTRSLHPADVTERHGIPCTTPARTLVDLAAVAPLRALERALELAQHERIFDGRALAAALARSHGRRGIGKLRRLLAALPDQPAPVKSELERRFLAFIRREGLPAPRVNEAIGVHVVDFQWPAYGLVVETDGRATHDIPSAFEEDRRRDLYLRLRGWEVQRVTWHMLTDEREQLVAFLKRRLA